MPANLRGYYVYERGVQWGIPVVAHTARAAMYIAFNTASELDCGWIDLRCLWKRDANVDGLPVGVVEGAADALRRGFYMWLEGGTCDICGVAAGCLKSVGGQAVCEACREVRTEWCDHHNRDVTLEDCVRCRFLCVHRPGLHESGLQSRHLIGRWGAAEIERYLDSLKGVVE